MKDAYRDVNSIYFLLVSAAAEAEYRVSRDISRFLYVKLTDVDSSRFTGERVEEIPGLISARCESRIVP